MKANLTFIVFSKDRPLQLHGLLRSLDYHSAGPLVLYVIYASSSTEGYVSYKEVFSSNWTKLVVYPLFEFQPFRELVLKSLSWCSTKAVSFLVDDILFIRSFDPKILAKKAERGGIGSLRLGENINFCYMAQRIQNIPSLRKKGDVLSWRWRDGELDWGYPMSVDGNIFNKKEITNLISSIPFSNPSRLEENLNHNCKNFRTKRGYCYRLPVLVNVPANKVQTYLPENRSAEGSVDDCLKAWSDGWEIDIEKYIGFKGNAVHHELELHLRRRVT